MTPQPQILRMTIAGKGKGDAINAASVATAIGSMIEILQTVDRNSWRVNGRRYTWQIVSASMSSPFNVEIAGIPVMDDLPTSDVLGQMISGLRSLDREGVPRNVPAGFDSKALAQTNRLVSVYLYGVLDITLEIVGGETARFSPSLRVGSNAMKLRETVKSGKYYGKGSIDGILRQVTADARAGHERSSLQIIDRRSEMIIKCDVTFQDAARLAPHVLKRVVLYGRIAYDGFGAPKSIEVKDFDPIDETNIPTLEEIHAMNLNLSGGRDAADVIDEMRGHGE